MNGVALCAGAGGLELALRIAEPGYRTVCYVEREARAAATLVARLADEALDQAPIWDDVTTFAGRSWRGVVDIVSGGYPCQGESNAGRRLGVRDPRWLWPHFRRILVQSGAEWGFFENVGAHLSRSFPVVAGDLARLGYRVAAGLFTAAECGASHQRERLFILAHRPRDGFTGERLSARSRAERGGTPNPVRTGPALVHPERPEWRTGEPGDDDRNGEAGERAEAASWPGASGEMLADAERDVERRQHRPGEIQGPAATIEDETREPNWKRLRPRSGDFSQDMAVPSRAGLEITQQPGQPGQAERGIGAGATIAELRGALPLCAPGPADPSWPLILDLDPALEPAVRGVADGVADRVDRLRLTGNGVFPLAGALAFRTLRVALAATAELPANEPVMRRAAE